MVILQHVLIKIFFHLNINAKITLDNEKFRASASYICHEFTSRSYFPINGVIQRRMTGAK